MSVASSSATKVTIQNSKITANRVGVDIAAPAGPVNQVTLHKVLLEGNATANIRADGGQVARLRQPLRRY